MKNRIAFLGDSLSEGGNWESYFPDHEISNFGKSGEKSEEILSRLDKVLLWKPNKVFLMMGINDLSDNVSFDNILDNYKSLFSFMKEQKHIELIIQSLLPINESMFKNANIKGIRVLEFNCRLRDLCEENNVIYLDLYTAFSTYTYQLIKDYTLDGLHLNAKGYRMWKNCLQSENLI